MAKIIYETTLLMCSSCVIFTGTVSAVLLMLAYPNDRILGISTRLVIGLCLIIVAIFSVGFVGTIAESIRALLIYACLLILFPVSVLLVEIILRLSMLSPAPIVVPTREPSMSTASTILTSTANPKSSITNSSQLATLIYSNSFTSDSISRPLSPPLLPYIPGPSLQSNYTTKQVFTDALSNQQNLAKFNISDEQLFQAEPAQVTTLQPTNFYLLFKDSHSPILNKMPSGNNNTNQIDDTNAKGGSASAPSDNNSNNGDAAADNNNQNNPDSKHFKLSKYFWSDIFTTSLSPRVETLVEYVLIGMLAFVLLQIVIAYLLASEIRTLRTELAIFATIQFNKNNSDNEEMPNLGQDLARPGSGIVNSSQQYEKQQPHLTELPLSQLNYSELQHYSSLARTTHPSFNYSVDLNDPSNSYESDGCMLTFEQHAPLVQVHANPDLESTMGSVVLQLSSSPMPAPSSTSTSSSLASSNRAILEAESSSHQVNSFNSNYTNLITSEPMDNKQTQFASCTLSSFQASQEMNESGSCSTNTAAVNNNNSYKTNRRNRTGSFRVTFDSAPEYFEANNDSYIECISTQLNGNNPNNHHKQQQTELHRQHEHY